MSYSFTYDEKSTGFFSSNASAYSDAPASTLTSFQLAPNSSQTAYGLLSAYDSDAYDLGYLYKGTYTINASSAFWFFGAGYSSFYSPTVSIYNSNGIKLAGGYSSSLVYEVTSPGQFFISVDGTFNASQYSVYYTKQIPVNISATTDAIISGTPLVGKTLTLAGSYYDPNGTISSSPSLTITWFSGGNIAGTGLSYVVKSADVGKLLYPVIQFTDDAGYFETIGPATGVIAYVINSVPVAAAATITTNEDTAKTGTLTGTDVDGNTLTFAKVTDPSHGAVSINASTGAYTYTPAANYNGSDSFTFKVNDGTVDSAVATVSITVAPVNDAPVASAATITTNEDTTKTGTLAGSDVDGNTLTFAKVTDPSHGTVSINATTGAYTYTPAANYNGSDSFTFKVNDGTVDSAVAAVSITVAPVNITSLLNLSEVGTNLSNQLYDIPFGNSERTFEVKFRTTNTGTSGTLLETGSTNEFGGLFSILILPDGRAYFCGYDADLISTKYVNDGLWHSVAVSYDGNAISLYVDGNLDVRSVSSSPGFAYFDYKNLNTASSSLRIGSSVNINSPGFKGDIASISVWSRALDLQEIQLNDNLLKGTEQGLVVSARTNTTPLATSATVTTNEDTAKTGTLAGTDVDGNTLTFAKVADPSHGTVAINASTGAYTYTPTLNYNGSDSFTFKVNDGIVDSAVAAVSITVAAVSDIAGHIYHWKSHYLLQGVQIADGAITSTTDSNGNFHLNASNPNSDRLTPTLAAQNTGSAIDISDALAALKIAAGRNPNADGSPVSPYQYIAADMNEDGVVTSADALAIYKMALNRTDAPAAKWLFVNEAEDFWNEAINSFTTSRRSVVYDKSLDVNMQQDVNVNLVAVLKGDVNSSWTGAAGTTILDTISPNYFAELSSRDGLHNPRHSAS